MKKLILAATFTSVSTFALAQEFQGVPGILKEIAEKSGKPVDKEASPVDDLRAKVKKLRQDAGTLAPADAAKRWVELLEAYLIIPQEQLYSIESYEERPSLGLLLTALPPSAVWDDIATLLDQRKSDNPFQAGTLRLLFAGLRGDMAARNKILAELHEQLKTKKGVDASQRDMQEQYLKQITTALQQLAGTDAEKIKSFEESLERLEKESPKALEESGGNMVSVPDLVRFTDEKTATALLTRLVKAGAKSLQIEGRATRLLASTLALKHISTLKTPLWDLVSDLDHAPLYEAMAAKFPDADGQERQQAAEVYLLALIAGNRTQDAVRLVTEEGGDNEGHVSISVDNLDEMNRQGLGKQVLAFLHQLLTQDAALPYWPQYIELSARQSASAGALKLLQDSLAKPALPPAVRATMQAHYYLALLAADQRDEGVGVLRDLVKAGPRAPKTERSPWGSRDNPEGEYLQLCVQMATLGRLLNQPDLVDEAVKAALEAYEKAPKNNSTGGVSVPSLINLLLDHGRGVLAEQVLTKRLTLVVTQEKPQNSYSIDRETDQTLLLLASVYDRTGRPKDALEVFELMPYWSVTDLAELQDHSRGRSSVHVIATRGLLESGRKEDAARIARRAVQSNPGVDAAYDLLLRSEAGQPLLDFLDEVAKRDRFEERPLIWKARVLLDSGRVDDAEKAVRAAIAIDPSDGEQGKGDRMRAYAVLAEVLEKMGDAETAKVMRGAVTAIRKSEEADDWWSAGLLSEAVRRYESALLDFADAYCIQSRLALRYSDLGQFDKAEKHYLRAFELMPDSFGRVESHCFGCEGAFSGLRAQGIADKVFTRLASLPPVKAQVFYLLGYLRSAQDRDTEAADAYRQATKTDPDYLNAWQKLAGLAEEVQMTRAESEAIALQIFRLDPAGRHSQSRLNELSDLRKLWTSLLAAEKTLPVDETGPLLPLSAAKAGNQAKKGGNASRGRNLMRHEDPRDNLLQHPLVNTLTQFVEGLRNR